jgi:tetratricopeptide (TPR) repeat protein
MAAPPSTPDDLPTFAGVTNATGLTHGGVDAVAAAPRSGASAAMPRGAAGMVGRYTITRLIGEGGMGAVYEAEQDQPRRTVALKVIKPGLASPELLRRFAQESQALGRLQHPGIAQIYDAGTADTGYGPQPYFAMEFIRGETLRDYAETHHLGTRQRLELLVKVCDAVHHAHQRGLIHRDLKPGNILVDEHGQPKILDFGVARVTDSDAQVTLQTDVGQLVGTLAYMSPEQVLADPLEIDIRSDVYALGVILYELLAGRLPYEISKKLHEALQAIREQDPSRLSSISRAFRGDIETIAAKALEKDKTRRYASAAELAADITHYLKDEPIVAQPPTTGYQLQKFARRHKALVGGVAAVFVVLVAGVVASTWQAVRASRAESAAVRDRDRAASAERTATVARDAALSATASAVAAEGRATVERDKAVVEKQRADTEAATAKAVSEFLQKNLFEQVTGGGQRSASPDVSVSGALDRAAARVDGTFAGQTLVEAGVREAIARAYVGLSQFEKAAPQVERALALRRPAQGGTDADVLKAEHLLAGIRANQRQFAQSERLLERVVGDAGRTLGRDHPETLRYAFDLGTIYLLDSKPERAEPFAARAVEGRRRTLGAGHRDTLTAMTILASIYELRQKLPQALRVAGAAYESARRAFGDSDTTTLSALAITQRVNLRAKGASGDRAARDEFLESAARTVDSIKATSLPEMVKLAHSRTNIAVSQGRPGDAEAALVEAYDAVRRAGQEDLELSAVLAGIYALQKKFTDAERVIAPVLERPGAWKSLGPTVMPFALRSLATNYRSDGKFALAEPYFERLIPLSLAGPGEKAQQTRIDLFLLADNYGGGRKYAEAERAFIQLREVQQRTDPAGAVPLTTASTIIGIGWTRLQQGRYDDAERSFRDAAGILTRGASDSWERHNTDAMLGASLAGQKRFADAEPLLLSGYEGMATRKPTVNPNMASRFTRATAGDAILQLYADWGKPEQRAAWAATIAANAGPPKP